MPGRFPLSVAVAGIGGFARSHHDALLHWENLGRARVIATCDPRIGELGDVCRELDLAGRGVRRYNDFARMLGETPAELVTLATPIHLHAPMHAETVRRGSACYLEKPPTLDPGELARMIEMDRRAPHPTAVGFNYVCQPERIALKRRIMAGEFGALQYACLRGLWRRAESYYLRNEWAGRLMVEEKLLLDSCVGNALSHHVNNLLFLCDRRKVFSWARPGKMRAELYRAHAIEGFDTVFASVFLENGVELRLAGSHACEEAEEIAETLQFEEARVVIRPKSHIEIRLAEGRVEFIPATPPWVTQNMGAYLAFLAGESSRPPMTLPDSRGFVELNALLYLAARRISRISPVHLAGMGSVVIKRLAQACNVFLATGDLPSAQNVPWATSWGEADPTALPLLREVIENWPR